ncbi:MAG: hypothetical protein IJW94_01310 [Oscillospiraceae bacterium]|nr:hypothetical protein [Oscillospiraceae bacterium]
MDSSIQPILYIDPGSSKPAMLCPDCGAECYLPGCQCLRCLRRSRDT